MIKMIVDSEGQVMGRLSSEVAKRLLSGEEIKIINCEKAVISGKPEHYIEKYLDKKDRGNPGHGSRTSLRPEKILRDSIRGMVPHKKERGKKALKRLEIVQGNPEDEEGEKLSKSVEDLETRFITIEKISKRIGGKNDR